MTGAAVERVLRALRTQGKVIRRNGRQGWACQCPAHDDHRPSLDVTQGEKGALLFCRSAGCSLEAIATALGLSVPGLFDDWEEPVPVGRSARPEIVARYPYLDEAGKILFEICRTADKQFPTRRPDGNGGWAWNVDGVRRVPYRLPEVLAARGTGEPIYVVEGEKDADALAAAGVVATCNPHGAGKWRPEFNAHFQGADVVIIADKDTAGFKHARDVEQHLRGVARSVAVLEPAMGKDSADHLSEGLRPIDFVPATDSTAPVAIMHSPIGPALSIDGALGVFRKWLYLPDPTAVLATLGAVAANRLEGDPVWLGLIAPPSSAKTEILGALSLLPDVHPAATLTPAGLLSGTPKKQKASDAKGGLLRQVGEFGILVLKDFGSVLSMRPDAKAEMLAAFREIFDGSWTRVLGTDGGRVLTWKGKLGLLFGATPALDDHHSVIGAMGERFVLVRMEAGGEEQARRAFDHRRAESRIMRRELAEAVAALFATEPRDPRPLEDTERETLIELAQEAVLLRSHVSRDRYSREIESIHGAEGPSRLALTLEQLLAGLDTLGVERATALEVVRRVARDSVPPIRRSVFELVAGNANPTTTKTVAEALGLPTTTTRRTLEDLAAYGLVTRFGQGDGRADVWEACPQHTHAAERDAVGIASALY